MRMLRAMAGLAMASLVATASPARTTTCGWNGATYLPKASAGSRQGPSYRLRIANLPRGAAGAAIATLWRFQTLAAPGGRVLSELRMYHSCPNGSGACSVSPPSRSGPDGGLYSEVVELNRDFSLADGNRPAHAIVLPGFAQADWTFTREEMAMPYLSFATPEKVTPDLGNQLVWLLDGCGRD